MQLSLWLGRVGGLQIDRTTRPMMKIIRMGIVLWFLTDALLASAPGIDLNQQHGIDANRDEIRSPADSYDWSLVLLPFHYASIMSSAVLLASGVVSRRT